MDTNTCRIAESVSDDDERPEERPRYATVKGGAVSNLVRKVARCKRPPRVMTQHPWLCEPAIGQDALTVAAQPRNLFGLSQTSGKMRFGAAGESFPKGFRDSGFAPCLARGRAAPNFCRRGRED
jgi:hypothetical protein